MTTVNPGDTSACVSGKNDNVPFIESVSSDKLSPLVIRVTRCSGSKLNGCYSLP
jgi:hypothetical protein